MVSARLPFMTRLPKKRGIIQDGEDETLTAHSARIASFFGNYFGMYVSRILKRNTAQVFT